jgi:acetyl-CoA carboxylase biotin carboxyl carrier protein
MTPKGKEGARGPESPPAPRDDQQIVDLEFLRGLIAALDDSGIDSLEVARAGTRIRIAKSPPGGAGAAGAGHAPAPAPVTVHAPPAATEAAPPPAAPAPAAGPAASNLVEIKSPMVGTFYRAPSPEAPSYVEVGSRVAKGQTLCILEAMKLMNELESEVAGVVREICVENSEPVEYGQALFRIEPEA